MKKLFFLIALTIAITGLKAQEVVNSSGGEASGEGGSASYSVGQVFYTTHTGAAGSMVEGVQQPYEISVVIGIEEIGIRLQITAYPNPVSDHLILKIAGGTPVGGSLWKASLYDMKGAQLKELIIVSNETIIDMANLKSASYFLKVFNENKEVKTFKIIKNK
jgi:hypothetical protein